MSETQGSRHIWGSIWAVVAGFIVVVVLSLGTDALLSMVGLFPKLGQPIADERLLLLATVYRSAYGVVGGFITARLAPVRPMFHALVGGAIGLVLATVGAIVAWNLGPEFGPHWYPISLVVTAMPCAWLGGKLAERRARRPN